MGDGTLSYGGLANSSHKALHIHSKSEEPGIKETDIKVFWCVHFLSETYLEQDQKCRQTFAVYLDKDDIPTAHCSRWSSFQRVCISKVIISNGHYSERSVPKGFHSKKIIIPKDR